MTDQRIASRQQESPGGWGCVSGGLILFAFIVLLPAIAFTLVTRGEMRSPFAAAYTVEDCAIGTEFWGNSFDVSWRAMVVCGGGEEREMFRISRFKGAKPIVTFPENETPMVHVCPDNNFEGHRKRRLNARYQRFREETGAMDLRFVLSERPCYGGAGSVTEDDIILGFRPYVTD